MRLPLIQQNKGIKRGSATKNPTRTALLGSPPEALGASGTLAALLLLLRAARRGARALRAPLAASRSAAALGGRPLAAGAAPGAEERRGALDPGAAAARAGERLRHASLLTIYVCVCVFRNDYSSNNAFNVSTDNSE